MSFDFEEIDKVFISHFHADHSCDAFSLIFSRNCNYTPYKKKLKKVLMMGPKNTEKNFKTWRKIFWPEPHESYPVDFREGVGEVRLGSIKVETFLIKHLPWLQSLGIIVKFGGKKLVYTGDLGSDNKLEDLVEKCQGADLLVIEASVAKPQSNHFTLQQVKELAEKALAKKVLIVHIPSPVIKITEDFCRKEPKFILAHDGLRVEI
ncbi:MAG: MBL fold metallo-hydrolase [Candidatus Gribaldobacteria bacterium]|nr:MBL fold metallo-hydrolase [Candidatus Gribaldobacteria bacterium]